MPDNLTIKCSRCNCEITHRCNTDLRKELIHLFKFRPESGFPQRMKRNNYYLPDKESRDGVDSQYTPFFSEAFLYPLLGKEDARTVLAILHTIIATSGIDPYEIEGIASRELDAEEKEAKEREAKRKERRKNRCRSTHSSAKDSMGKPVRCTGQRGHEDDHRGFNLNGKVTWPR